jgi:autotransporter adhesin
VAIGGWLDTNNDGIVQSTEVTTASGIDSTALGSGSIATGTNDSAFGEGASVTGTGTGGTAIGAGASVTASNAVALGAGSVASIANTVSVGTVASPRQITNVAAGTADTTDAVNMIQFGAATSIATNAQATATTALAAADNALAESNAQIGVIAHSTGPNATTNDAGDAATLVAANAHSDAGDATTLAAANAFTTTTSAQTLNAANTYTTSQIDALSTSVDDRFAQADEHIDRVGALSAALAGMTASAAAIPGSATRFGAAFGSYRGQSAFSVGVQYQFSPKVAMTLGGAFSGSDTSGTIGIGIGL